IDSKMDFRRLLKWQIRRAGAFQDLIDISGGDPEEVRQILPVANKPASLCVLPVAEQGRQPMLDGQQWKLRSLAEEKSIRRYDQRLYIFLVHKREALLDLIHRASVHAQDFGAIPLRAGLDTLQDSQMNGRTWIHKECDSGNVRDDHVQQFGDQRE